MVSVTDEETRNLTPEEKLLFAFMETRMEQESFPVQDAIAFVRANLKGKKETPEETKRLERDLELILEGREDLFYRSGEKLCCNRKVFFRNSRFKIRPNEYEIREGLLFYGARFAPYCTEEIFADEYVLKEKTSGKIFNSRMVKVRFSLIGKVFQMLGRSNMLDCIVADDMENYQILRESSTPEQAVLSLSAFDLSAFYKKHDFHEGDGILVTVLDWEQCIFELEYVKEDSLATQEEMEQYVSDLEEGLIQAYEEYGEYLEIPDQIAHALLCASRQGHDLRQRPFVALEEYAALMRDITIRRDGPEWTLVPVDEPSVSGGFDMAEEYEKEIAPEGDEEQQHQYHCSCGNHTHNHSEGSEGKCSCKNHKHSHNEGDTGEVKDDSPVTLSDFSVSSGRIDTLEHLLEDLNAPLDYVEIYAMVQDDLANGQESCEEFERKLIHLLSVTFADDGQEAAFRNFIEDCWEEAEEHFDPVIEQTKTPLRTRVLELNSKRLEMARSLATEYDYGAIPGDTVRFMKEFHGKILHTLALLNADCSLPEGRDYDLLELRIGDMEDAWDAFEESRPIC
ncbi:MAG: hypothetical protein J6S58_08215 [Lentisphaeria bacterium]|nr:hypothetical protein [Lentisphaeria bacterium]